ncbi:MAG TPA: hypothetical protein VMG63_18020 [Terriglobia bacterium]|nr:hypothetical protein [Terriglobia bacterium]
MIDGSSARVALGTGFDRGLRLVIAPGEDASRLKISGLVADRSSVRVSFGSGFDREFGRSVRSGEAGVRAQQTAASPVRLINGRNVWLDNLQGPASAVDQVA